MWSNYALCARWIRGRKAVTRNLPVAIDLLEDEEFLICFRTAGAGRVDFDYSGRVGARKCPGWGNLHDFDNRELDLQRDCCEDREIRFANSIGPNAGRKVLRHEHAVGS